MKRERPTTAAPRRIIEKEKVLTNMQEHLKHIQELEAERAAKHQEKRDKAKQKVVIRVLCVAPRAAAPSSRDAVARGVTTTCRRRDAPHNSHRLITDTGRGEETRNAS